jgi:hypothetical protein
VEIVVPNNKFRQCVAVEKSKNPLERCQRITPLDRPRRRKAACGHPNWCQNVKKPRKVAPRGFRASSCDSCNSGVCTEEDGTTSSLFWPKTGQAALKLRCGRHGTRSSCRTRRRAITCLVIPYVASGGSRAGGIGGSSSSPYGSPVHFG